MIVLFESECIVVRVANSKFTKIPKNGSKKSQNGHFCVKIIKILKQSEISGDLHKKIVSYSKNY